MDGNRLAGLERRAAQVAAVRQRLERWRDTRRERGGGHAGSAGFHPSDPSLRLGGNPSQHRTNRAMHAHRKDTKEGTSCP